MGSMRTKKAFWLWARAFRDLRAERREVIVSEVFRVGP